MKPWVVLSVLSAITVVVAACGVPQPACGDDGVVAGPFTITIASDVEALATCTRVEGDLIITFGQPRYFLFDDSPPVTTLAGLESLEEVAGSLVIDGTQLTDLKGLDGLRRIGESMAVQNNLLLVGLDGLSSLEAIEGTTTVCDPFSRICTDGLAVLNNQLLAELDGLSSLGVVEGSLTIFGQSLLQDLGGLSSLHRIAGDLRLVSLATLGDLSGLAGLADFNGSLVVDGVSASTLTGLGGITSVADLSIRNNPNLVSLEGLEQLRTAGSLQLINNGRLANLRGLTSLTDVIGGLDIGGFFIAFDGSGGRNSSLVSLDGLDALTRVGGRLLVGEPTVLSVLALHRLRSVGGSLILGSELASAEEPFGCNTPFPGLTTLDGLESLQTVGEDLNISCQTELVDIGALNNLQSVGGRLLLVDNTALPQCQASDLAEGLGVPCECSRNLSDGVCP